MTRNLPRMTRNLPRRFHLQAGAATQPGARRRDPVGLPAGVVSLTDYRRRRSP